MKSRIKVLFALLCSILIAGTPLVSMAADKIPTSPSILGISSGTVSPTSTPTPPGNAGLLSGMTPGNYKIPSGWSIVRTQDFEGTKPGDASEHWGGSATTERLHTGSKSMVGTYSADSSAVQWALEAGNTGSFTEIYLSFWEYTESQARFNDEYLLAHISDPNYGDDLNINFMWGKTYNSTVAYFRVTAEGIVNDTPGQSPWDKGNVTVPTGQWQQWEIHIRPGTPGQANGFFRIYLNGLLYFSRENALILGSGRTFNNGRILAGGYYTKIVWMKDYPTCSIPTGCVTASERTNFQGPGNLTDQCVELKGWAGQLFSAPKCAPEDPPLPNFKRYIDDVIVLKKTSG